MVYASVLLAIVVLCYLVGSLPFGYLVARLKGIDIRHHGSGNIGATNVWRVLGKKYGLPVFLLDLSKGLAAALIGKWFALSWGITVSLPHGHSEIIHLETSWGGIAGAMSAILGHNFPVWLRFKGGKGVATSLGVLFGLMPVASTVTFAVWGLVMKLTGYVSLASIIAALSLPLTVLALFLVPKPLGMEGWPYFYFVVVAALILVARHAANIRRLLAGTEPKMGRPKHATDYAPPAPGGAVEEKLADLDAEIVPPAPDPRAD